jgi:hypothetical protein
MRRYFSAFLIVVCASALAALVAEGKRESQSTKPSVEIFKGESIEVIEPDCNTCGSPIETTALPEKRFHPQGKLVDDHTRKQLKDFAQFNPDVPRGILVPYYADTPLLPSAPAVRSSFEGINQDIAAGFYPPDTQIAVGPNHILQATNGAIRLSSKTNTNVQTVSLNTFFAKPGVFLFDPKIFFDPSSGRFLVVVLEFKGSPQVSTARFAVSQSSNPASLTQGWCRYSYNGKTQGTWADYPSLGVNEKWLAISTNHFRFSDNLYIKSVVKAGDKRQLVNNASSCPRITLKTFSFPLSSGTSGTIQFAQSHTPTSLSGTPLFAVTTNLGNSNFYDLWRVSGSGSTPSITRTRLPGQAHSVPPNAKHKGSGPEFDTDFNRVLSAVHRNGLVSVAFATGCNFGSLPNESCVRIAQITPTDAGGIVGFEADYGGGSNKFFWMPAVVSNSANDIVTIYHQSGTNQFLGTAFTGKKSSASNLEPFRQLQTGKCGLNNTVPEDPRNRTGDYAGAAIDPADGRTFWISAEYAVKLSGRCRWGTRIGKVSY